MTARACAKHSASDVETELVVVKHDGCGSENHSRKDLAPVFTSDLTGRILYQPTSVFDFSTANAHLPESGQSVTGRRASYPSRSRSQDQALRHAASATRPPADPQPPAHRPRPRTSPDRGLHMKQ